MENSYGVGVKNRYELFYNEDVDPLEIIRQKEEEKEKRKTDKTQSKETIKTPKSGKKISTAVPKKALKETPVSSINKPTESIDKTRPRPVDRTFKTTHISDGSKDVEERKNFRNREDHGIGSETGDRESEARRGGRGGFRGRGRTRGRGGFSNNFEGRPPRRAIDHHIRTEKKIVRPVDKKNNASSSNWSDIKSEISSRKESESWMDEEFGGTADKHDSVWRETNEIVIQSSNREMSQEKTDVLGAENMDSKENDPIPVARTEGMKEMTLDEWKRQQEAKRAVPKYNLRKPGEGEDGNQWKKLYMLKKKIEDDEDEDEEDEEDVDDEEFARRGRQRQLVDIQINFNDSRRGRGRGRGVRGIGPRSTALADNKDIMRLQRRDDGTNIVGRNYGRGSRSSKSGQQSAPRVDDWNDFPSLVTV